jgi:hypothetical protein
LQQRLGDAPLLWRCVSERGRRAFAIPIPVDLAPRWVEQRLGEQRGMSGRQFARQDRKYDPGRVDCGLPAGAKWLQVA